jgi:beta-glucanase (GH16 family)
MLLRSKVMAATIGIVAGLYPCGMGGSQVHRRALGRGSQPWRLSWSDEFNGPNGSAPDPAKWSFQTGGNGFGNQELEYYTARPENAHIENGNLVITARREHFAGPDGVSRDYTSARLQTRDHFEQRYGRFEARIRLPQGQGIWPAFWMLGSDIGRVDWPKCGEIDIMENVGFEPSRVHGSLHGPGYSGAHPLTGTYTLPDGERFSDGYHLFAVEWEPQAIRFYVDNTLYETRTPRDLPAGARWVYDHPFFMLLNVAVGGKWPGNPDSTTAFPTSMLVDYVRVYTRREP